MNKLPYKYNLGDLVKLKEEAEIGMITNRAIHHGYPIYQIHWAYWGLEKRWLFDDDIEKVGNRNA